jgi:hypothetical protein
MTQDARISGEEYMEISCEFTTMDDIVTLYLISCCLMKGFNFSHM